MAAPITSALADLFPDTVIWEKRLTVDSAGNNATYAAPQNLRARVSGKTVVTRDKDGNEVSSTVHAIFAGAFGINAADRFTLPARFTTDPNATGADALAARQPAAINVAQIPDENGPHHEKVFF